MTAMVADLVEAHSATVHARPVREHEVNGGGHGASGEVADIGAFRAGEGVRVVRPSLSRREVEVLMAWLASDSKDEAAASLFISASTVSTHISRIRNKYAAVGRPAPTKAHLLARALQDGYTTLPEW